MRYGQPAGDDGRGRGQDAAGQRPRRGGADAAVLRRLRPAGFGEGSQSPEAGIRVTAVRVASFVPGETIEFDATPARMAPHHTRPARPTGVAALLLLPPLRRAG